MTAPHLTKTRGKTLHDNYEHARHDYSPCFIVDSVVNKPADPSAASDLCYIIDLPLPVARGSAWAMASEVIDSLSFETGFGRCLINTLSNLPGVYVIPHYIQRNRVSIWVPSDYSDSYCRPAMNDIVKGLPDSIWISIEYAIHRHQTFGRRLGELIGRI